MQIYDRAKRVAAGGVLTGILILGGCGQQTATNGPPKGGPPEVAVVTRGGMVYALAPGITNIKATSRGKAGSAYLVVRKETPPIEEPVESPPPPDPTVATAPSEPVVCDPRPETITW